MRAVNSVLSQSFRGYELIVIDDGSTESLEEVEETVLEAGHTFIKKENGGVASARNLGLRISQGDWIALLDSDDLWHPNKLEVQLQYHKDNPEYLFSQTEERWFRNNKFVNKKKKHRQPVGDAFERSLKLCCISSSSVIVRRELFDQFGLYDERLLVCEDYDFWIHVTSQYEIGLVPEILVDKYGGHSDQLSTSQPAMDRFRLFALLKLLSSSLTESQREQVVNEIIFKSEILYSGARKRGRIG